MDGRLELVQVPVSDVDRAKAFYTEKAGFNLDHDHKVSDEIRFVQLFKDPDGNGWAVQGPFAASKPAYPAGASRAAGPLPPQLRSGGNR